MNTFLLIDVSHLFNRAKYSVRGTVEEKAGMCMHILFSSLGKAWRTQSANHAVFAFDGRSWRKDVYAPYKRNRAEARAAESPAEKELNQVLYATFDKFREFVKTKTNCTVLENSILEADDLIAGFIQSHPNDNHVIVSGDKDFEQLLATNVKIYDGIDDQTVSLNEIIDGRGKPVIDKKTGKAKLPPDPAWSVFEKAMRGCTSDNIFSAYPGAREKGTKNKVGLREAFEDRDKKGFSWSAVVMHRWTDHNGEEHRVLDDYNRNVTLVDLTAQPENIQTEIQTTIEKSIQPKKSSQVGLHFLKFCGQHELVKISDQAKYFSEILAASFPAGSK